MSQALWVVSALSALVLAAPTALASEPEPAPSEAGTDVPLAEAIDPMRGADPMDAIDSMGPGPSAFDTATAAEGGHGFAVGPGGLPAPISHPQESHPQWIGQSPTDARELLAPVGQTIEEATGVDPIPPDDGARGGEEAPPGAPGFADHVGGALAERMAMFSLAGTVAAVAGVTGFAFVTRYISPKEALKNPQRAMLYGFVRATPGCHLKQLSEEFGMKSSSILWHIRKLESADLVRSERANGFRVFYPVAGGIELRRVSRGLSALRNANARRIMEHLEAHPGQQASAIARSNDIHPGTVRWHLRKMREFGLIEEVVSDEPSRFYPTGLGKRSLEALEGAPVAPTGTSAPSPVAPVPHPEGG